MKPDRERLDVLLVARGLADSLARAQALILGGWVVVGDHRGDKPGQRVPADAEIIVKEGDPWASRGAHKLLGALEAFPWLAERIDGALCLDIGASTGGFTDVLLQHGASKVIALDVGYGQLAWRLQTDDRVHIMDRTNIRHLGPGDLPGQPSVITCDVSFISVRLFLNVIVREIAPGGIVLILVKPQFELGKGRVGKGGVVRSDADRAEALATVAQAAQEAGLTQLGSADAAIAGPKGNREIVLVCEKPAE